MHDKNASEYIMNGEFTITLSYLVPRGEIGVEVMFPIKR